MHNTNSLLLHVQDPQASALFYQEILDQPPVEQSPGFAMFLLPSGLALGLWQSSGVIPAATQQGGAAELGFKVDRAEVDTLHADWLAKGARITLPPTDLDFGRSFVATDPDGHRLRVYSMQEDA